MIKITDKINKKNQKIDRVALNKNQGPRPECWTTSQAANRFFIKVRVIYYQYHYGFNHA